MANWFSDLTDAQATLLVGGAVFAGGIITYGVQVTAFFTKRHLTGAKAQERATLWLTCAELIGKMGAAGTSPNDLQDMERLLKSGGPMDRISVVRTLSNVANDSDNDDPDPEPVPDGHYTTFLMTRRAAARLAVVEAELNEAVAELAALDGGALEQEVARVERAWLLYRDREAAYVRAQYEGGTIAPLAAILRSTSITENRLVLVRAEVEEAKAR